MPGWGRCHPPTLAGEMFSLASCSLSALAPRKAATSSGSRRDRFQWIGAPVACADSGRCRAFLLMPRAPHVAWPVARASCQRPGTCPASHSPAPFASGAKCLPGATPPFNRQAARHASRASLRIGHPSPGPWPRIRHPGLRLRAVRTCAWCHLPGQRPVRLRLAHPRSLGCHGVCRPRRARAVTQGACQRVVAPGSLDRRCIAPPGGPVGSGAAVGCAVGRRGRSGHRALPNDRRSVLFLGAMFVRRAL